MFLTEISNRNQTKPNTSFKSRVDKVKMHQITGGFTVIFPKIIYTPNIYFRNTKTCGLCYYNLPKCVLHSHQALCKLSAYYNSWNLYPHPSFNIIDKGIFRLKRVSLFIHPSGSIRHEQKFPLPVWRDNHNNWQPQSLPSRWMSHKTYQPWARRALSPVRTLKI